MSKYIVTQDVADCIGCRACEVHCKDKNHSGPGAFYCRMLEVTSTQAPLPRIDFVYLSCFHCEKPWCVDACPTGAMRRRPQDGIVFVEAKSCVGCKACITACPWTVPQWNPETGRVEKCDLCMDRIDAGLEPACVSKCTTGCLTFTTPNEASQTARQAFAEQLLHHRR